MKEIWSNKYGKNPAEGLQQFLVSNIPGYKRQDLMKYIHGFAKHINKHNIKDSIKLASNNFNQWMDFVKTRCHDNLNDMDKS